MPTNKDELARILNIDPDDLHTLTPRWLELMQEGVIVQLTVRRWRAQTKLLADDLGLPREANDLIGDLLALGSKRLLPLDITRQLSAIESAGRKALDRFGFSTHWGTFVTASSFDAWRIANAEHKERYFQIRDRILADYDTLINAMRYDYRDAAKAAYQRITRLNPYAFQVNEYAFVDDFTARILALIPSADAIYASFAWTESLSYIPLPSMLADDMARQQRATLEDLLQKDALWKEIAITDAADRERREQLARMNDAVVSEARRQKTQLIDGFLTDLTLQLRSLIYDAVSDVLAAMQRNNDKLHPRSVVQLRNLCDQVGRLNFFGDAEADTLIAQMKATFDNQTPDMRNHAEIQEVLSDVATVVRQSLLALDPAARPLRTASLETDLDRLPPDLALQRARRRLNLDLDPPPTDTGIPVSLIPLFRAPRQLVMAAVSS